MKLSTSNLKAEEITIPNLEFIYRSKSLSRSDLKSILKRRHRQLYANFLQLFF